MCIAFFQLSDPESSPFRFILAANRDEFFHRPTLNARFWESSPDVLAGIDLEPGREGGTWLGVTKTGKFALLTNCREANQPQDSKGRGVLCKEFLQNSKDSKGCIDFVSKWEDMKHEFAGFNLIVGDIKALDAAYLCNRIPKEEQDSTLTVPQNELHGVSNGVLNEPWPKLEHGKKRLKEILSTVSSNEAGQVDKSELAEQILSVMNDPTKFPDEILPSTGVPIEWERLLSSIFVHAPSHNYGTRSTVIYIVDHDGNAYFLENAFNPETKEWTKTVHTFSI